MSINKNTTLQKQVMWDKNIEKHIQYEIKSIKKRYGQQVSWFCGAPGTLLNAKNKRNINKR